MENKNITLITSHPLTEPVVYNRLIPYMEEMLKAQYSIQLICPENENNLKKTSQQVELCEVEVQHLQNRSFFKRAVAEIKNAKKLLKQAKMHKKDVYFITIPSMFLFFLAPFILRNKKKVLDIRDLTWEYLSEESFKYRIIKEALAFLFKVMINKYYLVAVTNDTEHAYVTQYIDSSRIVKVSNGIGKKQFDTLSMTKTSESRKLHVLYLGTIGIAQNISVLVEAAKLLPQIEFTIVGGGAEFDLIQVKVDEYKLPNLVLKGRVNWEKVIEYYNKADILYAQLTKDFSGAMPSKLYEYLATGKFVIYGGQGQAVETLKEFEHNKVIEPCNVETLVEVLQSINLDEISQLSIFNKNKIKQEFIREDSVRQLIEKLK